MQKEDAQSFCEKLKLAYFDCSSKENFNVQKIFLNMIELLIEYKYEIRLGEEKEERKERKKNKKCFVF